MQKIKKLSFLALLFALYANRAFALFGSEKSDLDSNLDEFAKSSQFGNVYDYAQNLTISTETNSNEESFNAISKQLNFKYSCNTDEKDIYYVYMSLSQGEVMRTFAQKNTDKSGTDSDSNSNFVKSCLKISKCLDSKGYADQPDASQSSNKDLQYSASVYNNCRNVVEQGFINAKQNIYDNNSQKYINYSDDIFMNGKAEDSMFDLMKDVEYIGKVLFKNLADVHKTQFYKSTSSGGSSAGSAVLANLSSSQTLSNLTTSNTSSIINSSMCKTLDASGTTSQDEALSQSSTIYSTDDQNYNYDELGNSYQDISTINNIDSGDIEDGFFSSTGSTSDVFSGMLSLSNSLGSSSSSSSSSSLGNGGPGCGQVGNSDSILNIQFCMVDSKKGGHAAGNQSSSDSSSSSSSSTSGKSVEEIMDKMLEVLNETKRLGASMKHSFSDEWWETMLKDVKLKDIFSFDFVVKVKPVFGTGSSKTYNYKASSDGLSSSSGGSSNKDADDQAEKNKQMEKKGPGLNEKLADANERNKYVVLRTQGRKNEDGLAWDNNTYNNLLNTAESIQKATVPDNGGFDQKAEKKTSYETLDVFKSFIDGSGKFWLAMEEGLKYAKGTSENMKERVESGSGGN